MGSKYSWHMPIKSNHFFINLFSQIQNIPFEFSLERNGVAPVNSKANLSTDTSPKKGLDTPKTVRKIKSQNAITVSLPSPAGNRRSSRQGSISSNNGSGTKSSKEGKSWDKMKKVRKTVKQFSTDKGKDPKDGSSGSGGGGSSPTQSQHPPLKQSASARQLGGTSSNGGGLSPSQSVKKKKKKKKALPMSATVALVAATGRSDSLKGTSSTPNLAKFGPTRASQ